ncbi:MAG: hypothetical protein DRQ46_10550 [Gammaproteobacteria bacterium]|nr:MAG: hypothetical protein DRQ46_10550 [Gammaproteobacteria bacterium]
MLDITQIGEAIRTWIESTTGLLCIYSDGMGARPKGPYLTLKIISADSLGEGESEATDLPDYTIDVEHSKIYEIQASINAFRGVPFQEISKLVDSLDHTLTDDHFTSAGLGIGKRSEARSINEVINKKWENRAQVDLFFHARSSSMENIEGIKQIEITNEINGSTAEITHPDIS